MCSCSFTPKNIEWRGVEYIKYSASPKLWVEWSGGGKERLYVVVVVMVVEVKMVV
jgi:hypothetical protein